MSELEIPTAVIVAAVRAAGVPDAADPYKAALTDRLMAGIQAAAPLIIAAELRRMTAFMRCRADTTMLHGRADELDPDGLTA